MGLEKFSINLPGGKSKFTRKGVDYDLRTIDDATAERLYKEGCIYVKPVAPKAPKPS